LNPAMVTKKLTNLVSFFFLYTFLTTFNLYLVSFYSII